MNRGRLLTTPDAEAAFWLTPNTLQKWHERHLITPAIPGTKKRPAVWWELDVADTERATRRRPRAAKLAQLAGEHAWRKRDPHPR